MAAQDGEDQFQADLAKAMALSLETHAMEKLRREDLSRDYIDHPKSEQKLALDLLICGVSVINKVQYCFSIINIKPSIVYDSVLDLFQKP